MKKLLLLGLVLSTSVFSASIDRIKESDDLRSSTLKGLFGTAKKLHVLGEKEYSPAGGRENLLYKVTPKRGQKEWQAIRELVDEVNTFGEIGGEDVGEDATAFYRKRPNWSHVSVAFASDYHDRDDLSKKYVGEIYKLRNQLRDIIKDKKHIAFYRIFSSNEAQGHLGFVVYNRGSDEALYVSTVSDH